MAKCKINGGICGFVTIVKAENDDNGKVSLKITSGCSNIKKIAKELTEIVPFDEIFKRAISTKVYEIASKHSPHPSCVVPSGILKAVEVAADLALPQKATIEVEK